MPKKKVKKEIAVTPSVLVQDAKGLALDDPNNPDAAIYPDEVKVFCLSLKGSGYTIAEIKEIVEKPPRKVIEAWIRRSEWAERSPQARELMDGLKGKIRDRQLLLAASILGSVSEKDIEKANLLQKATAAGIMLDKVEKMEDSLEGRKRMRITFELTQTESELAKVNEELARLEGS